MRRNRYGGYRGRRTGRDILKILIGILAAAAVALAVFLWLGREEPEQPEQPEQVQPEQEQPEQEPQSTPAEPEPEPEPEPAPFVMAAVSVEASQVSDGSWEEILAQNGANALVLNMKPDDAPLNWVSAQSMAAGAGANSALEGINEAIRALNDADVYTVARMSCFRDELLAGTHAYCIRSNSDYRWKDFGGVHWVNVAVPEVRAYMIALAVELAELGFDEILLDNCGYPQDGSGEMGWIKKGSLYDVERLDAVVGSFLEELTAALEPYEVRLSIRTNTTVLTGNGARTGVTPAVLERYAEGIWMSEVGQSVALAELLTLNGITDVGSRLVAETAQLEVAATWQQAVVSFSPTA